MVQVPVVQFRGLRPDPGCKIFDRVIISSEKQAVRSEERCAVFLAIFINVVKREK